MTQPLPIPEACSRALDAVQADPLEPGAEVEAHMQICRACSEARVAYLAQEEFPEALAPAGYFDRLPGRVLRKLPARSGLHRRMRPMAWAAAAVTLMAVGAAAFWAGRANRTPYVEATFPRSPEITETTVTVSDTPFHDREEDAAQVQTLTPEEMKALLKRLDTPPSSPR
jgi:predicted anti-sigma-YlaC factor YlaD